MTQREKDQAFEAPHVWGPERRGWHFDKTVSIGNLIAMTPLVVVVVASWATMDSRIGQLERQRLEDIARSERQRMEDMAREAQARQELLHRVSTVDQKLDRVIERLPLRP